MDKRQIRSLEFTYQDIDDAINEGKSEEASNMLSQWLWANPEDPKALCLLGRLFFEANHHAYAYHLFKAALDIEPLSNMAWVGYGLCCDSLNRHDEAIKAFSRAYHVKPDNKILADIARAYVNKRDTENAKKFALACLKNEPTNQFALSALGYAQLFEKDLHGWINYQYGVGCKQRELRTYVNESQWNGETGKTVIVYGEQGMGDEICFASAYPDLIADSKEVIIDASPRFLSLFQRSFPECRVYGDRHNKGIDPNRYIGAEYSTISSNLFKHYRLEGYPGTAFLKPNKEQVKKLKKQHAKGKPLVGLAWTGGMPGTKREERSIDLKQLAPIYSNPDYTFISLEYTEKDLSGTPVRYAEESWSKDMDDVASLVAACDLVISVPTTVVHLAGALGVPCIAMVHKSPTVFYGLEGGLDLWNSVDVVRKGDSWEIAIAQVAEKLKAREAA